MIYIENIEYLFFLLLIPFLIICFTFYRIWQKKQLKKISSQNLVYLLESNKSIFKTNLKSTLKLISIFFLIISLCNPIIESGWKEVTRKGIEIMVALDVSHSMMCEDFAPTRMQSAKNGITTLLKKLNNDKIGLVAFAGEAHTKIPITTDYKLILRKLSKIDTGSVMTQGTDIGEAISQSMNSFDFDNQLNKSIIIITDGEDWENKAIIEARKANEKNVSIHTLSYGTDSGGLIFKDKTRKPREDKENNPIITKKNDILLSEISTITEGTHCKADAVNPNIGINKIQKALNKIEKNNITDIQATESTSTFTYFLAIAFGLIVIEMILSDKKNV